AQCIEILRQQVADRQKMGAAFDLAGKPCTVRSLREVRIFRDFLGKQRLGVGDEKVMIRILASDDRLPAEFFGQGERALVTQPLGDADFAEGGDEGLAVGRFRLGGRQKEGGVSDGNDQAEYRYHSPQYSSIHSSQSVTRA